MIPGGSPSYGSRRKPCGSIPTRAAAAPEAALAALVEWHVDFALRHRSLIVVQDRDWAAHGEALVSLQQGFRRLPGLVADGRDMGTVIFPDAPYKVFLTASAEERAKRRYKQLKEKGVSVNLAGLLNEIAARDERDAGRAVAPLKPADDAVIVEASRFVLRDSEVRNGFKGITVKYKIDADAKPEDIERFRTTTELALSTSRIGMP